MGISGHLLAWLAVYIIQDVRYPIDDFGDVIVEFSW
jgi:hypothetical protein